jgi:hypothetical protein
MGRRLIPSRSSRPCDSATCSTSSKSPSRLRLLDLPAELSEKKLKRDSTPVTIAPTIVCVVSPAYIEYAVPAKHAELAVFSSDSCRSVNLKYVPGVQSHLRERSGAMLRQSDTSVVVT